MDLLLTELIAYSHELMTTLHAVTGQIKQLVQ